MGDDVIRLTAIGALARRRWRILLLFALVGALVGFGLSFVLSPGHQASSKILLKGQPDKNQLLSETQIATSLAVLDHVADDLQWGVSGIELQGKVAATVLDGNVLEIAGVASTTERARALTDKAAAEYVAASNGILNDTRAATDAAARRRHDAAQKQIDDLQAKLAAAQAKPPSPDATAEVNRLTSALSTAQGELAELDRQAAPELGCAVEQRNRSGSRSLRSTVVRPRRP